MAPPRLTGLPPSKSFGKADFGEKVYVLRRGLFAGPVKPRLPGNDL
jgi:hypothetical protein